MSVSAYPSTAAFVQIGNDKWLPDGWDLDRLIIKMQGPKSALAAYIASLTMWSAAGVDGNMYLSGWSVDDDPVKPSVDLNYIGCKNNNIPPRKHSKGSNLRSESTFGFDYLAPTDTETWISRTEETRPDPGEYWPGSQAKARGIRVVRAQAGSLLATEEDTLLALLTGQVAVANFQSEEAVPNTYWRNTLTKTISLIPLGA
jgi:hypothetical protein